MKTLLTATLLILLALPSYADWKKGEQDFISSCEATTAKNYNVRESKLYCGCFYNKLSKTISWSEAAKLFKSGKFITDARVSPIIASCLSLIVKNEHRDKLCHRTSAEINKETPITLDRITSLSRTMCMDGKKLVYYYLIKSGDAGDKITSSVVNKQLQKHTITGACSTPATLSLLKLFDLGYIYYTDTNKYIGEFAITSSDCDN